LKELRIVAFGGQGRCCGDPQACGCGGTGCFAVRKNCLFIIVLKMHLSRLNPTVACFLKK
jgi:hypothetical protein